MVRRSDDGMLNSKALAAGGTPIAICAAWIAFAAGSAIALCVFLAAFVVVCVATRINAETGAQVRT